MRQLTNYSSREHTWQIDFKQAIKSQRELESFFDIKLEFKLNYPVFIPYHFAEKIKIAGHGSPLWNQFIPTSEELEETGLVDPIGDHLKSKGDGIIHRYKNRILFTPTTICPIICRYCFRKNELYSNDDIFKKSLLGLKEYLANSPEVNEVILTGGDPLILGNANLDQLLKVLSTTQISFVRFHTRTPIILPNRIDLGFIELIEKYSTQFKKLLMVVHTNHIDEIDTEVAGVLELLSKQKIECLTQSVLLKGVNDSEKCLKNLLNKVIDCNFRPYYLHHPDKVRGGIHFYISEMEGKKIFNKLRNDLPGWALPQYVVDSPDGSGKKLV